MLGMTKFLFDGWDFFDSQSFRRSGFFDGEVSRQLGLFAAAEVVDEHLFDGLVVRF